MNKLNTKRRRAKYKRDNPSYPKTWVACQTFAYKRAYIGILEHKTTGGLLVFDSDMKSRRISRSSRAPSNKEPINEGWFAKDIYRMFLWFLETDEYKKLRSKYTLRFVSFKKFKKIKNEYIKNNT